MRIRIGKRWIGDGCPVFVIAEVGSNHNCDIRVAEKIIKAAAAAGADVVKFQTYSAETLYSSYTPFISEMKGRARKGETPYQLIKRIAMPRNWQPKLKRLCDKYGVMFASTPFDLEAVQELDALNVPFIKIASYETDDVRLLRAIGKTRRPVIMSTGSSDLKTVSFAYQLLKKNGSRNIVLLHCVSQYPAKLSDINLRVMLTLKNKFGGLVGFSDHTLDSVSSIAAVAQGASVIEKHITLNKKHRGPDHSFSLEPEEFKVFVENIRAVELLMGESQKRVQLSEVENSRLARRSIHAVCDIKKGECIKPQMLMVKRPGLGIKPRLEKMLVGKKARINIKKDRWITWGMVS